MVLTVEPGLYIEEYSIGIRIEDDALVTDNGCEILSEGFMKTTDEIEGLWQAVNDMPDFKESDLYAPVCEYFESVQYALFRLK